MPINTLQVSAQSQFLAQPSSAGVLVLRSSDAADTFAVSVSGLLAGSAENDSIVLDGLKEVIGAQSFDSLTAVAASSPPAGMIQIRQAGEAAVGDIRVDAVPVDDDTLEAGLTGHTRIYTFKDILTGAANEIAIGANRYETARNICRALLAGTGSGVSYGVGTVIHEDIEAWADSEFTVPDLDGVTESTVYLRDKIPCARQTTWDLESTSGNLSLRAPIGGVDGVLIVALNSGLQSISSQMEFYTPDLALGTLLAGQTPISDPVYMAGRPSVLHVRAADYASPITVTLEASDDGETWTPAGIAVAGVDDNEQWIDIPPREWLRMTVDANTNVVDVPLHAVLIGP